MAIFSGRRSILFKYLICIARPADSRTMRRYGGHGAVGKTNEPAQQLCAEVPERPSRTDLVTAAITSSRSRHLASPDWA
jgi:hypothetical protein